jgi:DNA-binding NtrC family response regulator
MIALIKTIRKVAPTLLTVLLTGETGTGKEVLAQAVHRYSDRSLKPFVAFNCSAVPRELVESQLFGYRRGAFSGAHESFAGVVRSANGGTLFLDEVGEIALDVQPKLLRFIESGEVQSLGESQPTKTNVRLIFATNSDLESAVRQHRFREDLFFRMNVIRINIPPLRARKEEIPLLIQFFISRVSNELRKPAPQITMEAMEHLISYSWPGNVRQLANEVRRFVALVDEQQVVTPELLSEEIVQTGSVRPVEPSSPQVAIHLDQPLLQAIQQIERQMLNHALKTANGRVSVAAKSLGLSRKGLYLKRQRLGLAG